MKKISEYSKTFWKCVVILPSFLFVWFVVIPVVWQQQVNKLLYLSWLIPGCIMGVFLLGIILNELFPMKNKERIHSLPKTKLFGIQTDKLDGPYSFETSDPDLDHFSEILFWLYKEKDSVLIAIIPKCPNSLHCEICEEILFGDMEEFTLQDKIIQQYKRRIVFQIELPLFNRLQLFMEDLSLQASS